MSELTEWEMGQRTRAENRKADGYANAVVDVDTLLRLIEETDCGRRLKRAVIDLYMAGKWSCDRSVDEASLWAEVRDAAGIPVGTARTSGIASGMEAPSGGETVITGSTEGDSPVGEAETPNDPHPSSTLDMD